MFNRYSYFKNMEFCLRGMFHQFAFEMLLRTKFSFRETVDSGQCRSLLLFSLFMIILMIPAFLPCSDVQVVLCEL